jgi:hemolysin activation/secretion protein
MTESIRPLSLALVLLCLASGAGSARAQASPPAPATTDPAQLQRQREALERERLAPPPKPVAPRLTAPAPESAETASAAGPSFVLKRVEFAPPSQLLTAEQLDAVVQPQLGKPVTFADIRRLAEQLNALYLTQGHLTARVFVPSQKIADGVLKVQLVEARLVELRPPADSRLSPRFLDDLLATPVGALIDAPALNERLTRLHRNTDNRIGLAFQPAATAEPGFSVVQVQTEEPPFWTARLSANNEGADSVGKHQLSAQLALNNLLGRTDKLSLLLIRSKGSTSGNLQYSVPLPGPFLGWGTRLTTGLSVGRTQSVAPGFDPVSLDGNSDGATLGLAQPLWSSGPWALDGGLSLSQTNSRTDIAAERFSDIRTRAAGLTATLSRNGDGSSAALVLAYNHARTVALGLPDRRTGVAQVSASLQQLLGAGFWTSLRAVAQHSDTVQLPPTLQFQVGGPGSVRGYPSPSASGDDGESASLELHRALTPLSERLDGYVFVDGGRARTDGGASASLASAGVGFTYTASGWSAALAVASPQKALRGEKPGTRTLLRLSVDLDRVLH